MQNEKTSNDINTKCIDCGKTFTITAGAQRFFLEKGLALPNRCLACRKARLKIRQQKDMQISTAQSRLKQEQNERELAVLMSTLPYNQVALKAISISEPSKELVIIGNGFDIMHGVPSSYREFEKTIGKSSELRFHMETYLQAADLWSNLEESLATLNASAMIDVIDMWLDIYGAYAPDAKASDYQAAIDTAMLPIAVLTDQLPKRFRSWVESLKVDPAKELFPNLISPLATYLNFNYTEFLETVYHVPASRINYIHGCRKKVKGKKKDTLILGHVPNVDYLEYYKPARAMVPHYKSERKAYLLESAIDTAIALWVDYYEGAFTKKTPEIIKQNSDFFSQTASMQDIVVIGHSLSQVDHPYFQEIVKANAGKAQWHIGYHSLDDLKRLDVFVTEMGLAKNKVELFRT